MKRVLIYMISGLIGISLFTGCGNAGKTAEVASQNFTEDNSSDEAEELEESNDEDEEEEETLEESAIENKLKEDKVREEESVQSPNVKKLVVIDPGHASSSNHEKEKVSPDSETMKIKDGGGAEGIATKTPEYKIAMSVSLKLKELLEQNGISVIMTKTSNEVSLGNIERAEVGNSNNADLEIRIHCDSAESQSAKGASMLVPAKCGYAASISDVSRRYGETILKNVISTAKMNNRGIVEREDLTGFNWSKVPVVLIEMGFLSNPEEDKLLNDDSYQNKLAQGMCNGILEALNS